MTTSPKDIQVHIQKVNKAANTFLNRNLSEARRLKAIEGYSIIFDENQVKEFKKVLMAEQESPAIKAMALNKIYDHIPGDEIVGNKIFEWFSTPATPRVLRDETLKLMANLTFSSMISSEPFLKMMEDPDMEFRGFAFSRLLMHGDQRAQQRLIQGLEDPKAALLPPVQSIELLSLAPKKEYYPTVYKLLLETKDDNLRLTSVQALGAYREAREKLIEISMDSKENEDFRTSALLALYSGDRDNIVKYVTPILLDKTASVKLQGLGIQMTIDVRQAMTYRLRAQRADKYDLLIKEIADGKGVLQSEELQQIASKYILAVRPSY
jgi:HEAT repeat protein